MGGNLEEEPKSGPALEGTVHEVQGRFSGDDAMQDAFARLELAGYDRAYLSLPSDRSRVKPGMLDEDANPTDTIDKAQVRTMGASMAGYMGAAAAAGATIATGGGLALAAAAAAAIGAGAAVTANALGQAVDQADVNEHDQQGAAGKLILAVRTQSMEQVREVMGLMRDAGATSVETVTQSDKALAAGISATP
jgi:hypothetical protein